MPVVYTITNTVNGKVYVGATVNFVNRKSNHIHHFNRHTHHSDLFQEEWDEYGQDAFVFRVVEQVKNRLRLHKREQYWIDTLHPALNRSPTAISPKGVKHTPQARKNMSRAHKGKKLTPEAIAKRTVKQSGKNHWAYGKPVSEETRKKISRTLKRRFKKQKQKEDK